MVPCNCIVQDGQISAAAEASLKTRLDGFTQRAFGAPAEFSWVTVPEKSGFTAGKPSTSSIVTMRAPAPLDQSRRAELLRELSDIWTAETNCTLNELVAVIADPAEN